MSNTFMDIQEVLWFAGLILNTEVNSERQVGFYKLSKKRDQGLMKPHWNGALEGLILVLVMTWYHSIQGKLVFLGPILKRAAIDQNKSQVPQADSSLQFPTSWEHLQLIPSCDRYESIATLYKTVAAIHPSNRKLRNYLLRTELWLLSIWINWNCS